MSAWTTFLYDVFIIFLSVMVISSVVYGTTLSFVRTYENFYLYEHFVFLHIFGLWAFDECYGSTILKCYT